MVKLVKILKLKNTLWTSGVGYFIRVNRGIIKILGLCVATAVIMHLGSCIWVGIGLLEDQYPYTWIWRNRLIDKEPY
jgi:hypothetical protein